METPSELPRTPDVAEGPGGSDSKRKSAHYTDLHHQFPLLLDQFVEGIEKMRRMNQYLLKICHMNTNLEREVAKATRTADAEDESTIDAMPGLPEAMRGVRQLVKTFSLARLQMYNQVEELVALPIGLFVREAEGMVRIIQRQYQRGLHARRERKEEIRRSTDTCIRAWEALHIEVGLGNKHQKVQQRVHRAFVKHEALVIRANDEEQRFRKGTVADLCRQLEALELKRLQILRGAFADLRTAFQTSAKTSQVAAQNPLEATSIASPEDLLQECVQGWVRVYGQPNDMAAIDNGLPCSSRELANGDSRWIKHMPSAARTFLSIKAQRHSAIPRSNQDVQDSQTWGGTRRAYTTGEHPTRLKDLRLMATSSLQVAEAMWDYQSDNSEDLEFKVGDLITVLEKHESGWWRGEFNGQLGVFPGNYVRLLDAPGSVGHTAAASTVAALVAADRTASQKRRGRQRARATPPEANVDSRLLVVPSSAGAETGEVQGLRPRPTRSRSAPAHHRVKMGDSLAVIAKFSKRRVVVELHRVTHLRPHGGHECDPQVILQLESGLKTGAEVVFPRKKKTSAPVWNTPRLVPLPFSQHPSLCTLKIRAYDTWHDGKELLGAASVPLVACPLGKTIRVRVGGGSASAVSEAELTVREEPRSPKYLFFVRHGESEWNLAQDQSNVVKMMKKVDHSLSNEGRMQAEALAALVRRAYEPGSSESKSQFMSRFLHADIVYSSPLTRALQTAVISLQHHEKLAKGAHAVRVISVARERRSFGGRDTQGKKRGAAILERLEMKNGKLYEAFGGVPKSLSRVRVDVNDSTDEWWDVKRESDDDFESRLDALMEHICYSREENIIVVSHSYFIRGFFGRFLSEAYRKSHPHVAKNFTTLKLKNCSVAGAQVCFQKNPGESDRVAEISDLALLFDSGFVRS